MTRDPRAPSVQRWRAMLLVAALCAAGVVVTWAVGEGAGPRTPAAGGEDALVQQDSIAILLRERLSGGNETHLAEAALVTGFYRERNFQPAWSSSGVVGHEADELAGLLRAAGSEGLDPEAYRAPEIDDLLGRVRAAVAAGERPHLQDLATLDLLLSDGFLAHGSHLLRGRVDPRTVHPGWILAPRSADLVALLHSSIRSRSVAAGIRSLQSGEARYARLRRALQRYREIERQGGWPTLLPGPTLKAGDRGERVARLRERLAREITVHEGDSADVFGPGLEAAVREFQRRHGMREDGVVGPETRAGLEVSVARRVSQIELALERLRWLPSDLGPVHLVVRIPAFELEVVERGRRELNMRIIGGRPDWPTPIFSGEISSVVLSPYWNIPASIAAREVVPEARRDPGYMDRNEIRVVSGYGAAARMINPRSIDWARYDAYRSPYRLRQEPGPRNPLGGVKFVFPNSHNVYLHDTPGKHLFAEPERAFSHGCMRVEKPLELALYLLRGSGWSAERIEEVIAHRREHWVSLPAPVPVHILYETVWAGPAGDLHFRADLYGHDQRLARALAAPVDELSAEVSGECEVVTAAPNPRMVDAAL